MICKPPSRTIVGHAPAKLNLFFEIFGKRPDGYHDVCSLCCPISLFDTIYFETQESPEIEFCCESGYPGREISDIPTNAGNLVVKAIELLRKHRNVTGGCRIRLIKRIPSQAGLGGGSSDAATAIRLANQAWQLQLSQEEMIAIGAQLGSDVPLFFIDGLSLGYGRGEQVKPIETNLRLDFVVVKPAEGISTAEAFGRCAANRMENRQSPERIIRGLQNGNRRLIASGLFNRLETTAKTMSRQVRLVDEALARMDCTAHLMTGSGTACFALCHHQTQARQLAKRLSFTGLGDVFVASSVARAQIFCREIPIRDRPANI